MNLGNVKKTQYFHLIQKEFIGLNGKGGKVFFNLKKVSIYPTRKPRKLFAK
jgi:hypothetical protein